MDFDQTWYIYLVLKRIWNPIDFLGQGHRVNFLPRNILVNTRINILQWILTKLGTNLVRKRIWNPIDFQGQGHQVKFLPCNMLVNTRINILQWILTKLRTYLVLKRIWNPIDFQGQRSRSPGQIFRQGDMPCFVLPLFTVCSNSMIK